MMTGRRDGRTVWATQRRPSVPGGGTTPPHLVLNPIDDDEFVRWASRLGVERAMTPESLQSLLRFRYRSAVVRRRELSGEPDEIWYVYRDGHWTPRSDVSDKSDASA